MIPASIGPEEHGPNLALRAVDAPQTCQPLQTSATLLIRHCCGVMLGVRRHSNRFWWSYMQEALDYNLALHSAAAPRAAPFDQLVSHTGDGSASAAAPRAAPFDQFVFPRWRRGTLAEAATNGHKLELLLIPHPVYHSQTGPGTSPYGAPKQKSENGPALRQGALHASDVEFRSQSTQGMSPELPLSCHLQMTYWAPQAFRINSTRFSNVSCH